MDSKKTIELVIKEDREFKSLVLGFNNGGFGQILGCYELGKVDTPENFFGFFDRMANKAGYGLNMKFNNGEREFKPIGDSKVCNAASGFLTIGNEGFMGVSIYPDNKEDFDFWSHEIVGVRIVPILRNKGE